MKYESQEKEPGRPGRLEIRRRWRWRGLRLMAISGFSQFGQARDDWGNRFLSWNTVPIRHVVLEERYLNRNPYLGAPGVAHIADPADPGRVFRSSPLPRTFNGESVEYFNASCGLTIYRGDLLPVKYRGNAFVCEPLTNLVHRRLLLPQGPTFEARRGEQGKEFLASTDPWFHPVNLATGPDGALYVADFYRELVEHPAYVPAKLREQIDFRKGQGHGRLWRIRPRGAKPGLGPQLNEASAAHLAGLLSHANGWQRDTAQRLLVERQDRQAAPLLAATVRKAALPQARVHALWTLHGLNALTDDVLGEALQDPHPAVREHALRLCEGKLSPALRAAALTLANDPAVNVRFRLAALLGEAPDQKSLHVLAELAQRDVADPWMRVAILSTAPQHIWPLVADLLEGHREWLTKPTADQVQFLAQVGSILGASQGKAKLASCLELLGQAQPETMRGRLALLAGLGEGLARSGQSLRGRVLAPGAGWQALWQYARQSATSSQETPERRVLALRVLGHGQAAQEGKQLLDLLFPRHPVTVQAAAAQGLATLGDSDLAAQALVQWNHYTIATRRALVSALLRTAQLASVLVEGIEKEKLAAAELDPAAAELLRRIPDADLQKRARKLLAGRLTSDRPQVVVKYRAALGLAGDRQRGDELFKKYCATCHQMLGQGRRVGPDLSGAATRPRETLLVDILDPSKEIPPDYMNFVLVTRRGQVRSGLLASESATAVTIRRAEGVDETFPRSEIEELRGTQKSLMPEGLEQVLGLQDIADLLEFLRQPRQAGRGP